MIAYDGENCEECMVHVVKVVGWPLWFPHLERKHMIAYDDESCEECMVHAVKVVG
jgi:hypothetical protein